MWTLEVRSLCALTSPHIDIHQRRWRFSAELLCPCHCYRLQADPLATCIQSSYQRCCAACRPKARGP